MIDALHSYATRSGGTTRGGHKRRSHHRLLRGRQVPGAAVHLMRIVQGACPGSGRPSSGERPRGRWFAHTAIEGYESNSADTCWH